MYKYKGDKKYGGIETLFRSGRKKCKGLEELLKKEIDEFVQITDATYEALIWYYYCYSVGDILSRLEEEFSDLTKAIIIRYFGSLRNYADFLKEKLNL